MGQHRVVVTGLGAITPIGNNVKETWDGFMSCKSGAAPITRFDHTNHKVHFACEVKDYDPEKYFDKKEARRYELFVQFALIAAREALADSGIDVEKVGAENIGTMIGSGIGGLYIMEEQTNILFTKGPDRVSPLLIPKMIANMGAGQVSISLGLKGPNSCPVTACASSSHAIGDAFKIIQRGQAVAMVAGGTESTICALGVAGFSNMKALSTRNDSPQTASRPFSKDRDGFVMGEGSGILVLEDYEHAKARGAQIYAEIIGYGLTSDANHITAPAPEHEGAQRAIRMALKDAEMSPDDLDYINAHGTSTPLNDEMESLAIKRVFGERAYKIPVTSNKSSLGHLLGAAGGAASVSACLSIKNSKLTPTINFTGGDEACDLDYVTEGPRDMTVDTVMANTFGFGGHNASLIFRKV